jgi:hypothetical protein
MFRVGCSVILCRGFVGALLCISGSRFRGSGLMPAASTVVCSTLGCCWPLVCGSLGLELKPLLSQTQLLDNCYGKEGGLVHHSYGCAVQCSTAQRASLLWVWVLWSPCIVAKQSTLL